MQKSMQNKQKASKPKTPKKAQSERKAVRPNPVYAPAAYGSANRMNFGRLRELRVPHTEPILTVSGITTAAVTKVRMNPGLSEFAPWLSGLAVNFESYSVDNLSFSFVTRAGSTKTGRVVMAVDYDALDSTPVSFLQVSNFEDAIPTSSWEHATLRCSKHNLTKLKERYIRNEPAIADQDLRLSDIGSFFVWVEGQDNTNAIGDIYVSYDIVLRTPQAASDAMGTYGGSVSSGGTLTASNPLGTAAVTDADSVGFSIDALSVVTFKNPGLYTMSCLVNGGTLTAVAMTGSVGAVSTGLIAIANGGSTSATRSNWILVTVANATVAITATAVSVSSAALYIGAAPYNSYALVMPEPLHVPSCPVSLLPNCPLDVGRKICTCANKLL